MGEKGELWRLSATEMLAGYRERVFSPVEVMASVIARAEAMEPTVNAFTWTFFDRAMAQAAEAEARYLGRGAAPGAFEGLPVAIKEEMGITGLPGTLCSLVFERDVAEHTHPVARRIMAAGGIVHAKTAMPEFACAGFTWSRLFGATRNPWNPAFDVGGSSGGAAAALAAGTAALANGSDIGGSIRIPASCCGIVGLKPSFGRWPQEPPYHLDHYSHEGPMARTVADCALFYQTIAGADPGDIASLREPATLPERYGDVRGWKIALSMELGGWDPDEDVRANTLAAAQAFRDAGAIVEEVEVGFTRAQVIEAAKLHYGAIFGSWIAGIAAEHADLLTPYALAFADLTAGANEPGAFLRGLMIEGEIGAAVGTLLQEYRLLLAPTLAIPALPAGEAGLADPRATGWGPAALPGSDHLMTIPFNICSRCPVVSVPSGLSRDGVPTGLQIVGRTFCDADVLNAAAVLPPL
ncbi:MAG: amidase [Thermomicrobiales bacterium]